MHIDFRSLSTIVFLKPAFLRVQIATIQRACGSFTALPGARLARVDMDEA